MNSIKFTPKLSDEESIKPKEYVSIYTPISDDTSVDINLHLGDYIDLDTIKEYESHGEPFTLCKEEWQFMYPSNFGNDVKGIHHLSSTEAECILKPNTRYKVVRIFYMVQEGFYDKKCIMENSKNYMDIDIRKFNLSKFIEDSLSKDMNSSLRNLFIKTLSSVLYKTNFIKFILEKAEEK